MSISFPKTWTSEKLNAEDVRDNLDAMKLKQQQLSASDMQLASKWIDTEHIMQGRYTSTTNITENVSGTFGGRNNGAFTNRTSYCSRWLSEGTNGNTRRLRIPYAAITFDILRPCTIFFQWHMIHQSNNDADGTTGETVLYTALNSPTIAGVAVEHIVAEQPTTSTLNILVDGTQITNGFILRDIGSQIKGYNIGLVNTSTAGMCQNISWSVSLEMFYM
jgi:hypothetical protein